jgi:PAS domain S-box-containing protein
MGEFRTILDNIWHRLLNPRVVDARLALAIEGANDGLWDWDLKTNKVQYSPRWSDTLGFSTSEIGDNLEGWLRQIHPDDLPLIQRAFEDHFSGKTPFYQAEFRMRDKNDHYRWIFGRGVCARDNSGKPIRLAGSMTDITLLKGTEAALSESERRYRGLFEATVEAIIIHKDGRILDVNHAFEHAWGYSRAEAVGGTLLDLAAAESRDVVRHCIETDFIGSYEAVALRKDDSTFPVEVHIKRMEYDGQEVRVTALRDMTERQRMEAAEREQRELAEALLDIARAMGRTLDLNDVLDTILETLGRVVKHTAAYVMFIENGLIHVARSRALPVDEWLSSLRFKVDDVNNLRTVIHTRQPYIIDDVHADPLWVRFPETGWIRANMTIPITVDGDVIALLNLSSDKPNAFTQRDADTLVIFAASAAFALRNARLYEAELQAKKRTQTLLNAMRALSSMTDLGELLQTILQQAAIVVPYITSSIGIIEGGQYQFKALAGYDETQKPMLMNLQADLLESPLLQEILNTRQPVLISDVSKNAGWTRRPESEYINAWMAIPLLLRNEVIGVLAFDSDEVNRFTSEHLEIAEAFASNAAIAIARVRLLEAERQARQQAQALLEANRVLSSTLSLEEVLENILQQCAKVLPYTAGAILAYGEGLMPIVSVSGFPTSATDKVSDFLKNRFRESDLFQQMVADPQPLIIADVRDFKTWVAMSDEESVRGWMGLPLMVRGKLVGVLMLCSDEVDTYKQEHAEIARAFADQAAIAIYNAQLYHAEQMERALAETLQQTAEALASSLQLESTMNLIVELLAQVITYDTAAVSLIEGDTVRLLSASGVPNHITAALARPHKFADIPLVKLLTEGKPIILDDAQSDSRWYVVEDGNRPRGWMGVPLIAYGKIVGILTIGSYQPMAYSKRDLDAVCAFGNQAAIAIENSRLLRELEDSLYNLRNAQIQLVHSARLSAAGEVSLGVAHQINNPLTVIIAEAHLMQRHITPGSPLVESVAAINEAAKQAGLVVQRMLDFSRTLPMELENLDINASLRKAILLFRAQLEPHITLISELDDSLPLVYGSDEQLGEVWLNLLLNARDALHERAQGTIRIVSLLATDAQSVEVHFADDGPGIAKENLKHVFEPFFTTKHKGTGLGLALSRDYIIAQGGSLQVESKENEGTSFLIRLPLAPQQPRAGSKNGAGENHGRKNSRRRR